MSTDLLKLKARVSAQERLTNVLFARIEEVAEDVNTSFTQSAEHQASLENKIDTIQTNLTALAEDVTASFQRNAEYQIEMEQQTKAILTNMATKEDIEILTEAIKQLTATLTQTPKETKE